MKKNKFYALEKIKIHNSDQWLLIRGNDKSRPILLYVQAGPGLPMISEANTMEKNHALENDFIVVYWDQRGCGKSFSKNIKKESLTLQQMTDDTLECSRYLLNRFQRKKLNIAGFSIGGSIALMAASKNPEFFSSVVTVGADLWMSETNRSAFDFAMKQAIASQNQTAIKELSTLANKPIMTPGQFQMRAKWLTDFGGIYRKMTYNKLVLKTIKNMLLSKEYSFADILKSIRGIDYVQQCMLPGLNDLNLFNEINMIKVPWYLFQGAHDPLVPLALTEKFFINIKADKKEIIVFHDSSHMPHYEQPLRFREALLHAIHASV